MSQDRSGSNTNGETVDRRGFLGVAAAAAAGLAAGACDSGGVSADAPNVQTRQNVRWRLASSFPESLDALYGGAAKLAERVSALTGGRFEILPSAAGELIPPLEVLDGAQNGAYQIGHTASYYYTGKAPVVAFDTGVPFGLTARQQTAWLYHGGGLELMHEVFADFNLITIPGGNTGTQMGGWFKREIATPADLRGLKMRIPGLGAEVMDRLGVNVQVLAGGDIYPALERGAIDATEWVGPYDDEKLGLHQAAQFYYYPGWWEPGPSMSFMINRSAWDQLSEEYKEVLRTAAVEAAQHTQTTYDAQNPAALQRLIGEGVQLRRFSPEIMRAAQNAATAIMEERSAADAAYRRVYENWKTFRDASHRWFGTSEHAYAEFAYVTGAQAQ